jgi:hypothetical protein
LLSARSSRFIDQPPARKYHKKHTHGTSRQGVNLRTAMMNAAWARRGAAAFQVSAPKFAAQLRGDGGHFRAQLTVSSLVASRADGLGCPLVDRSSNRFFLPQIKTRTFEVG